MNNFSSDKWELMFSNIPVPSTRTAALDVSLYNNFVRSVTLPDFNMETIDSNFKNTVRRSPISRFNDNLTQITIEFQVDEDMDNWHNLFQWMLELRKGEVVKGESYQHNSTIKNVAMIIKDNENRTRSTLYFNDCFIVNLSSLNLQYGSSEALTFSVTLNYEQMSLVKSTATANN